MRFGGGRSLGIGGCSNGRMRILQVLLSLLQAVHLSTEEDVWVWGPDVFGSVCSRRRLFGWLFFVHHLLAPVFLNEISLDTSDSHVFGTW